MSYTIHSKLTWSAEEDKLYDVLVAWGAPEHAIKIEAGRRGSRALAKSQSLDERTVTVQFRLNGRQFRVVKSEQARSIDNLAHLRIALERIRMLDTADCLDILKEFAKQLTAPVTVDDPYQALGLPPDADVRMIKQQYRAMAALHHPDKNGGHAGETWLRINQAYTDLRQQLGF